MGRRSNAVSKRSVRPVSLIDRDGVEFPLEWEPFVRTKADLKAIREGCWFDLPAAEKVRTFFSRCLRHSQGEFAGKPFHLANWQWFRVVGPLYGWKRPDGRRRFRKAYVEIPKKNGKSTLCSGLSIFGTMEEPGAEAYLCASAKDQAAIVYDEAVRMVEASPLLLEWLEPYPGYREIRCARLNGKMEVLACDGGTAQGKNASLIIADELHAWTGRRGRDFYESILYASRARSQPLFIQITTAGDDRTTVCWEQHQRAERVLAGDELATDFLPVIFAADPDGDWRDIEQWKQANPSFGVTMDEVSIRSDIAEAEGQPTLTTALKRYGLNQWVGSSSAWLDMTRYRKRLVPPETVSLEEIAKATHRAGGVDLASEVDFAAVAWCGEFDDKRTLFAVRIFIPGDDLDLRAKALGVPLQEWLDAGWIETTEGNSIDSQAIRRAVIADAEIVRPAQIGYDRWNADQLCNQELREIDGLPMIVVSQQHAGMAIPTREFEQRILRGEIEVPDNPVLNWMAGNVCVRKDAFGNIIPHKLKSKGKIDGIVACIIALSRVMERAKPPCSFYVENEVEFL